MPDGGGPSGTSSSGTSGSSGSSTTATSTATHGSTGATAGSSSRSSSTASTSRGSTGGTSSGTTTSTVGGSSGSSSGSSSGHSTSGGGESWVWLFTNYSSGLATVAANATSFTHISPMLYDLNYDYQSGVAELQMPSFDGLTPGQVAQQIHQAGLKCIAVIQGGASNNGTDQGIQNLLSSSATANAFITAMVGEAMTQGYDGYNLDWEVGVATSYAAYGPQLITFLTAFSQALHQQGLTLSIDIAAYLVEQSNCSGDTGWVDITALGGAVDEAISMSYAAVFNAEAGSPPTSCPASVSYPLPCNNDVVTDLVMYCGSGLPLTFFNIALLSAPSTVNGSPNPIGGSNAFAGTAIEALESFGYDKTAVWPAYNSDASGGGYVLLDPTGIAPSGSSWYSLLEGFLASSGG
jgi:hypothetical protein